MMDEYLGKWLGLPELLRVDLLVTGIEDVGGALGLVLRVVVFLQTAVVALVALLQLPESGTLTKKSDGRIKTRKNGAF